MRFKRETFSGRRSPVRLASSVLRIKLVQLLVWVERPRVRLKGLLPGGILTHLIPIGRHRLRLLLLELRLQVVLVIETRIVLLMPRLVVLPRRHLLMHVCPAKIIDRLRCWRELFEILRRERLDLRRVFEGGGGLQGVCDRLFFVGLLFLFLSGVRHQVGPLAKDVLRLSFDRAFHHLFECVSSLRFARLEMLDAPFDTGVSHLLVLKAAANIDLTALFGLVAIQRISRQDFPLNALGSCPLLIRDVSLIIAGCIPIIVVSCPLAFELVEITGPLVPNYFIECLQVCGRLDFCLLQLASLLLVALRKISLALG